MKVKGTQQLSRSSDQAYAMLTNPDLLPKVLPGCESFERLDSDTYRIKIKLGVAALSGSYEGTVQLRDQKPPERLRLTLESKGPWGFAQGDGALALEATGDKTTVHYEGELKVGGMIASVGQRLLDGVARKMIGEFFSKLDKVEAE